MKTFALCVVECFEWKANIEEKKSQVDLETLKILVTFATAFFPWEREKKIPGF